MNVSTVYEEGVFRPRERIDILEHQEVMIYFWPEIKSDSNLEKAYAEASRLRPDLEDWTMLDGEGWK